MSCVKARVDDITMVEHLMSCLKAKVDNHGPSMNNDFRFNYPHKGYNKIVNSPHKGSDNYFLAIAITLIKDPIYYKHCVKMNTLALTKCIKNTTIKF